MAAEFTTISYEKAGGVAHLALNRPERLNAYSVAMRDDFAEALSAVEEDPEAKAMLITGRGRAFCAGADLSEFGMAPSQTAARRARWQRDVWGQLIRLSKPVVAAVHGYCIGSGLEIALLAEVRIAAESTVFAMPEAQLGMIPAAGGSQTLRDSAGPSAAMDLLLTGRRFGAKEAQHYRLVSRVVPDGELWDAGWQAAQGLAEQPAGGLAALRHALRAGADLRPADGPEREGQLAARLMDDDGGLY